MPTTIDPATWHVIYAPPEEDARWQSAQAEPGDPVDPSDQPPPPPEPAPVPHRSHPRRHTTPAREAGSLAGSLVNDVV